MRLTAEVGATHLVELVKQVAAGHEVLLTQNHKPVARLVSAEEIPSTRPAPLQIPSIVGHRILTPNISQAELGEDMFGER